MTLKDLLNADMRTLGQWLRQALAWWLEELSGLIPPRWRAGFSARPRVIAERIGDGYRLRKDGREIAARPSKPLAVVLALPADCVLIRELSYPRLALHDVRRLVALDLDRLTPFHAEAVYFDVQASASSFTLAVVTRAAAAEAMRHAIEHGLKPEAVGVAEDGAARFDFLPSIRATAGLGSPQKQRLYWWGAVAALLMLNLLAPAVRDMAEVGKLRRTVEAQQPAAEAALRIRQKVEGERRRRAALLERRTRNEPLRVFDAATRALSRDAWTQRFEWSGAAVRLSGYKSGGYDALSALRAAPAFANVRSVASDAPAKLASGQPFDIAADVRAPR